MYVFIVSVCIFCRIEEQFRDACQSGDLDVIRALLAEMDPEEAEEVMSHPSGCSGTPLFEAILSEQTEVVRYLLDHSNVNIEKECHIDVFFPMVCKDQCE